MHAVCNLCLMMAVSMCTLLCVWHQHQCTTSLHTHTSSTLPTRSHKQGRPKGENREEDKKKFSLAPVATRLQERLGKKVSFAAAEGDDSDSRESSRSCSRSFLMPPRV